MLFFFRLPESEFPGNRREVYLSARHFFTRTVTHQNTQHRRHVYNDPRHMTHSLIFFISSRSDISE